jgi:hypothetical protein
MVSIFCSFLGEIVISARDDDERGVATAAAKKNIKIPRQPHTQ